MLRLSVGLKFCLKACTHRLELSELFRAKVFIRRIQQSFEFKSVSQVYSTIEFSWAILTLKKSRKDKVKYRVKLLFFWTKYIAMKLGTALNFLTCYSNTNNASTAGKFTVQSSYKAITHYSEYCSHSANLCNAFSFIFITKIAYGDW